MKYDQNNDCMHICIRMFVLFRLLRVFPSIRVLFRFHATSRIGRAPFFFCLFNRFLRQFISKSCVMASVCVFDINACGKNKDNIAPKFMYVAHSMQLIHTHIHSFARTMLVLRSQMHSTFSFNAQCAFT